MTPGLGRFGLGVIARLLLARLPARDRRRGATRAGHDGVPATHRSAPRTCHIHSTMFSMPAWLRGARCATRTGRPYRCSTAIRLESARSGDKEFPRVRAFGPPSCALPRKQVPQFRHPDHPEWDLIQWDLENELVWDPREVSLPVSGDDDAEFWYVTTKGARRLSHLPPMIVLFQIISEPTDDEPGVILGLSAWKRQRRHCCDADASGPGSAFLLTQIPRSRYFTAR
jgi:hypothetical protein